MTIKPIVNKHPGSKNDNGHGQNQSSVVVVDVDGNRQINVNSNTSNSSNNNEHDNKQLAKRRQKLVTGKRRYHQANRSSNSNSDDLADSNESPAKLLNVDGNKSEAITEAVDKSNGNNLNGNVNNITELNKEHETHKKNPTEIGVSIEDDASGYNSGDEYADFRSVKVSKEEWDQRDMVFARTMEKHGFFIKKMDEDGACLFRAVAEQVYGDQNLHQVTRDHCMDYIKQNAAFYGAYITEDVDKYVNRKRNVTTHGNHLEIRAMSELYHRSIEIYCYQVKPISVFNGSEVSGLEPIRLSYQRGSHYDAILRADREISRPEPSNVTRLPYELDQRHFKAAVQQSEDTLIEQAMMEDKLKASDFEATNEEIEEQVARESYITWIKENELRNSESTQKSQFQKHQQKQQQNETSFRILTTSTITSTTSTTSKSDQNLSMISTNEESNSLLDYSGFSQNQSSFNFADVDEAEIIAQVMAESQIDYLEQLKKTAVKNQNSPQPQSFASILTPNPVPVNPHNPGEPGPSTSSQP